MRARMGVLVATIAPFIVISLSMLSAHAQAAPEDEGPFIVSPGDFTVRDAPPQGEPYLIEQKIAIRNRDNAMRTFTLYVRPPLEDELTEGFDAIPNENWIILMPMYIEIDENSSDMAEIIFDIPRWENLTGQRWEARIAVERQPKPGELVAITYEVKAYIETTKDLPPPPSPGNEGLLLLFAVIIILAVGVVGMAFLLARHRRGEMEFGIASSAHPRNSSPWLK